MSSADPSFAEPGRVLLGRHEVIRQLGAGGMGVVYLGRSLGAAGFSKPVVIKQMLQELAVNDEARSMFEREARILARLRHPNIVNVVDFGIDSDGSYVLVMDQVPGSDLGKWAGFRYRSQQGMPVDLAVHIAIEVLDALHYAHELRDGQGNLISVIHRDISPSNILLETTGRVYVVDFGIARSETEHTKTSQAQFKGKFAYMAPELLAKPVPYPGLDVYSTALCLYEILAGGNPFRTQDPQITLARVLQHVPPSLSTVRPDMPQGLSDLLDRSLAKDPRKRLNTAGELRDALLEFRGGAGEPKKNALANVLRKDFYDNAFWKGQPIPYDLLDPEASDPTPGPARSEASSEFKIPKMTSQPTIASRDVVTPPPDVSRAQVKRAQPLTANERAPALNLGDKLDIDEQKTQFRPRLESVPPAAKPAPKVAPPPPTPRTPNAYAPEAPKPRTSTSSNESSLELDTGQSTVGLTRTTGQHSAYRSNPPARPKVNWKWIALGVVLLIGLGVGVLRWLPSQSVQPTGAADPYPIE